VSTRPSAQTPSSFFGPPRRVGRNVASLGLLLLWACSRGGVPAGAPASGPDQTGQLALDTPANAARSALTCIAGLRAARAAGDRAATTHWKQRLVELAAADTILERHRRVAGRPAADESALLARFVGDWPAVAGYYTDHLQPDRIEIITASADGPRPGESPGATRADAYVPATGPAGEANIRLECVRGKDGLWRVARIDFAPAPASCPTSQPQP